VREQAAIQSRSRLRWPLVDAHAHLYGEAFAQDMAEVLARAREAGVVAILGVSESLSDAREILELSRSQSIVKPCAGLHPEMADEGEMEDMANFIREHRDEIAAIGEVGLDYWVAREDSAREIQRRVLAKQVGLSLELDLPLNVHSRSAGKHTIELLRQLGAQKVLLHAFDGRASSAALGLEAGYYFSMPPSLVRSPQKQKLVRHLPLERLLLESDSPVLGPTVQDRNEPANLRVTCSEIARIKGVSEEEVARITTQNAQKLFPRAFIY
jgi:TatD DNase family protein